MLHDLEVPAFGGGAEIRVRAIMVKPGDRVAARQPLLELVSGARRQPLLAAADGVVREVLVATGAAVLAGQVAVRLGTGDDMAHYDDGAPQRESAGSTVQSLDV
jgi:pyruvate/2-oxoglutarate dehydrogenase complex dihydrolipoamide acyltransferase (E2) component